MFCSIEIKGKDSFDYLAKVLASNVRKLEELQAEKGLYLDGSSKILGQFDLIKKSNEHFFLLTFSDTLPFLKEELEKFIFAENIELIERQERYTLLKSQKETNKRVVEFKKEIPYLWPSWIVGYDFCANSSQPDEGWEYARVSSLVPWPNHEWKARETFALDAGFYSWIDRNKGCYPGQEVIEKSLNLGHPGKCLFLVEGSTGKPEFVEKKDLEICSVAESKGKIRAIVRCRWRDKDLPLSEGWKKIQESIPAEGDRDA
ncbi:MAG: hypothetical protein M9962_15620 [Oligoflexia bacterium]|nr:hypothetical protein [Oligoflexia bacterium]